MTLYIKEFPLKDGSKLIVNVEKGLFGKASVLITLDKGTPDKDTLIIPIDTALAVRIAKLIREVLYRSK